MAQKERLVEVNLTFRMRTSADHDLITSLIKKGIFIGIDSPPHYIVSDESKISIVKISSEDVEGMDVGDAVYHKDVFFGRKLVYITKIHNEEVEVEVDFFKRRQKIWLPISGIIIKS